jgi:OmcA/MtrC family decaheme c-type cytochrome
VTATTPAIKNSPPQSVDFVLLVHNIHTGFLMQAQNRDFYVVGHGGSINDFSNVLYPAMGPTGNVSNTQTCSMCHVNSSEELPLQAGLNPVLNPAGPLPTMGTTTAACTACHGDTASLSHVVSQTTPQFGEACVVCHGTGAQFDVDQVHAQTY